MKEPSISIKEPAITVPIKQRLYNGCEAQKGNRYLYEKLGYHQTGKAEQINDKMTIVFYEKD